LPELDDAKLRGSSKEAGRDDDPDVGKAENETEAPLPKRPGFVLVDAERICGGNRVTVDRGVTGTWAICATPLGARSMLSTVVGFVLAAILLNVFGLERYDDVDGDGDGDGGLLGGKGLTEASSSASKGGDCVESRV
jgi:hypothetical protein